MLDILWPSAVAEGRAAGLNMTGQNEAYIKGSPFNSCLLFGLHIATIGQINPRRDKSEENGSTKAEPEVIQHLSRGSSEVWFTQPASHTSAWSEDGHNTLRLIISGDYLVGALVIGDQSLADPLRYIIENQINIHNLIPYLHEGGPALKQSVQQFWSQLELNQAVAPV